MLSICGFFLTQNLLVGGVANQSMASLEALPLTAGGQRLLYRVLLAAFLVIGVCHLSYFVGT
jgi:hypothetical protein